MSLDHGMLNFPISKRGVTNTSIQAFVKKQRLIAKAKRKAEAAKRRATRARAMVLLKELMAAPGLVEQKATMAGATQKAVVERLKGWAQHNPDLLIKAHAEWMPK